MEHLAAALQEWRPHVLTGYPSVVTALADLQLAGELELRPVQVFTGGERLTPGARARIVEAWGAAPFDQYLTAEAGFVAIECSAHDGLHVLDTHVVVEVVDDEGAAVPHGADGDRVLITVPGSRTTGSSGTSAPRVLPPRSSARKPEARGRVSVPAGQLG